MQISQVFVIMCITVLSLAVQRSTAQAQQQSPKVFWQKMLPNGQKLQVTRREVPYNAPSPEQLKKWEKEAGAKITVETPSHVWQYSLFSMPTQGGTKKLLWRQTIEEHKGTRQVKFYDAYIEGSSTVLIFKATSTIMVWQGRSPFQKGSASDSFYPLVREGPGGGWPIESVTIEGTFKAKTLAVKIEREQGPVERFAWKNRKWVEQAQKNGKWVDKAPTPTPKPAPLPSKTAR